MTTSGDYLQGIEEYLSKLSIGDYKTFIDFCFRAPTDMRVLISELERLRSDIERYREDAKQTRQELIILTKESAEQRLKADKYDRLVERLQPVDGGQYVNDLVEAFWKYLKNLQYVEDGDLQKITKEKIEIALKSANEDNKDSKTGGKSSKRNTPVLGINRIDQDEITKPSKTDVR